MKPDIFLTMQICTVSERKLRSSIDSRPRPVRSRENLQGYPVVQTVSHDRLIDSRTVGAPSHVVSAITETDHQAPCAMHFFPWNHLFPCLINKPQIYSSTAEPQSTAKRTEIYCELTRPSGSGTFQNCCQFLACCAPYSPHSVTANEKRGCSLLCSPLC